MFGAPVNIIEDVEGDHVVVIICNCHLFLGYEIIFAHRVLSKDTLEMWNCKTISRLACYFQKCISGIQMHVLVFWAVVISITIRFFSCVYYQTCNTSTVSPDLLYQYLDAPTDNDSVMLAWSK